MAAARDLPGRLGAGEPAADDVDGISCRHPEDLDPPAGPINGGGADGGPGYALAVLLSILACWLVNVASAGRLAAITATILLLVPPVGSVERMLGSRVFEVGWGVCVAIATVWVVTRVNRRLGVRF